MKTDYRITVNLTHTDGVKLVRMARKNDRKPAAEARIGVRKHIKSK